MPYWTDKNQNALAKLLTMYQETGCTNVRLRNHIMTAIMPIIEGAVRSINPGYLPNASNQFDDFVQHCWTRVEQILYKIDPEINCFNYITTVCRQLCMSNMKTIGYRSRRSMALNRKTKDDDDYEVDDDFIMLEKYSWEKFVEALLDLLNDDVLIEAVKKMYDQRPEIRAPLVYFCSLGLEHEQAKRLLLYIKLHSRELIQACRNEKPKQV